VPIQNNCRIDPAPVIRNERVHLFIAVRAKKICFPVPLRNRCTVIELPALNMKELANFTQREVARRGLSEQSAEAIVATLAHPISRHGYFSLRDVVRMIDRAEVLESKPRLH
jgi:hypothetical protein